MAIWALGLSLSASAQTDLDLRNYIAEAKDVARMRCALEIDGLASLTVPNLRVIGTDGGSLLFYGFGSVPSQVRRVGRIVVSPARIQDMAGALFMPLDEGWEQAVIATVAGGRLYLLSYLRQAIIRPHGYVSDLWASRVAMQTISFGPRNPRFELVVGTTNGVLQVFESGLLPDQPNFNTPISLGTPRQTIVLSSNSPVGSIRYATSNLLVVASGRFIYRYARQSNNQFVLVGKLMYAFAPIVEMVANANYIVAASEDGYIYAWDTNGNLLGVLKERYNGQLGPHCLALLPSNNLAVGYYSVRVYSLPSFTQVGEVGVPMYGSLEWGNVSPIHYVRPAYSYYTASVLPPYSSGVNMPVSADINGLSCVMFVNPVLYHRYYPYAGSGYSRAVYSAAQMGNLLALGYADGHIRVYEGGQTSPRYVLNVGMPIMAMSMVTVNNLPWILFSAGAQGEIRAWQPFTNQQGVLVPAGSVRVVYALRVQAVSGNTVWFWTASSNGMVEQWLSSLPAPANLVAQHSVSNAPLWSLDISAQGHVAVGGADGIRYLVGSQVYSAASGSRVYSVAFRPGTSELAISSAQRLVLYALQGNSLSRILTLERGYSSSYPYFVVEYSPALLSWLDSSRLAAASIFGGRVRLYSLAGDSSLYHQENAPEDIPGVWDRNPVQVYEPVKTAILAFVGMGNYLMVGSASGEAVAWANTPINFQTHFLTSPTCIDFSRIDGTPFFTDYARFASAQTHPSIGATHVLLTRSQDNTEDILYMYGYYWIGADRILRNASGVPVERSIKWRLSYGYLEFLPNLHDISDRYGLSWKSNTSQEIRFAIHDLYASNANSAEYAVSPPISVPPLSNIGILHATVVALSPNGQMFAMSYYTFDHVLVYSYAGGTWSSSSFTLPRPAGSGYIRYLRFIYDNLLVVAYPDGNPLTWRLALYQYQSNTWQQVGTPVDTQLRYYGYPYLVWGRNLDAVVPSGASPRIALVSADGVALYKVSGFQIQPVARFTAASSGFLEASYYSWVRFSRYNPNRLGLGQYLSGYEGSALVVDVANLNW